MTAGFRFVCSALLIGLFAPCLCGDSPEKDSKALMRKKLAHAQRVLEGLVINDFDKIIDNAKDLMVLSKQNEWRVLDTPQFEVHSNDFRRTLETVVAKARVKNGDGTALAYVEMTLSCIRCHKHIREVRMTQLDARQGGDRLAARR